MAKYYQDLYCPECGCQLYSFYPGGQLICDNCNNRVENPVPEAGLTITNLEKRVEKLENTIKEIQNMLPFDLESEKQ